jgi:hypothetical protein
MLRVEMTPNPYQTPGAPITDRRGKPRGFIPDWIVILGAVILSQILSVVVVPDIAAIVYWELLGMPFEGVTAGVLWLDLIFTALVDFGIFWGSGLVAKYRPQRTILLTAAVALLTTIIRRWYDGEYDMPFFPMWYEVAIPLHIALAGALAFLFYRYRSAR